MHYHTLTIQVEVNRLMTINVSVHNESTVEYTGGLVIGNIQNEELDHEY